jgi:threonine dehydratase
MESIDRLTGAVERARARIAPHVRRTPVEPSAWLSALTGADVHCKLENHQLTGSFKLRGAVNRVLGASEATRRRGFVAASTGNHGAAVAHAAKLCGSTVTVFVPRSADSRKVERLRRGGVPVETAGEDCLEAEAAARAFAERTGSTYVSPYNDPEVVAGQGTLGAELAEQVEDLDAVLVALGGGGLAAGSAAALKAARPGVEIVACSPARSAVMIESIRAGRILDLPSTATLSDGTAGGVEAGSVTFDWCRRLVDDYVTVDEVDIAAALRDFVGHHHSLIEGAAAVPVAALLAGGRRWAGRRVAVVLCGANIALHTLRRVLDDAPPPPA